MDRLTLDTNELRNWLWCEGKSQERRYDENPITRRELSDLFAKLRLLRDDEVCEIGVTSQLWTDYDETPGTLPGLIAQMIGPCIHLSVPSIFTLPLAFPVAFPERSQLRRLLADTFPGSSPHTKKYKKQWKDVLQLYAHKVARRDFFITEDHSIMRRAEYLCNHWGIHVLTLADYIAARGHLGDQHRDRDGVSAEHGSDRYRI